MLAPVKKPPSIAITKSEVFIIESLTFDDEKAERFEGKILANVLKMCGKNPIYFYFRTEAELEEIAKKFRVSGYRYLHISCHGNDTAIYTTLGEIPYARFADIFKGRLKNRRLFVSACGVGNELFSTIVAGRNNKGMYSVAAPSNSIRFDHAVALWSSFYVKAFSINDDAMKGNDIKDCIKTLCSLFGESFHWSSYKAQSDRWIHLNLP